ncbi:MAG: T9SS type A sorting domain-containing protein, partial [Flavobacteriales bacterium]
LIDQLVFVNELNLPSDFKVYPNPASDELVLVSSKDIDFEYVLINMHGREVRSGSHQAIGYIDISGVNSGVYLLKVWTGENSTPSVVRIMVK